jgi:hypothetical protein
VHPDQIAQQSARKVNEIEVEYDERRLAYPVGVLKGDGTEGSIPTIRRAFQYLISELKDWNATPE